MDIRLNDILTMKKAHPCGSRTWRVLRTGADFRLKCVGCGHQIMVARKIVEKNTKDLKKHLTFEHYTYNIKVYGNKRLQEHFENLI